MRSRTWFVGVVTALALPVLVFTAPSPAPSPRAAQAQRQPAPVVRPTGTATVTVTVVVADEGTAVKGARVILSGGSPISASTAPSRTPGQASAPPEAAAVRDRAAAGIAKVARSSSGGTAVFTDLPAGDYVASVLPPTGYISTAPSEHVRVASGGQAGITARLVRGGVITGRVFDDEGDPVTGASVLAFRVPKGWGRPQGSTYGSSQATNDLGVYRAWSVAPGDYIVMAQHRDDALTGDDAPPLESILPTYFPGVASVDEARIVQVKAGMETGGVDIQLVRGRVGTVTGRVVDSTGAYAGPNGPMASVSLVARGLNPAVSGRGGSIRQDGSFAISSVPAGEYYVTAVVSRGTGVTAQREGAYLPITVNGGDVAVTLQTNVGATVSGRVNLQGVPPVPADRPGATAAAAAGSGMQRVRVMARTAPSRYSPSFSTGNGSGAAPRADGTFTLTGLRGPIQFSASGAGSALVSVTRGASDISGRAVDLVGTERIDDLVITLTYDTGGIRATMGSEDDVTLPNAAVVIYPEEAEKWGPGTPFVRVARATRVASTSATVSAPGVPAETQPTEPGAMTVLFPGLAPGRYVVVGLLDGAESGSPDAQTLERWREFGKVVTVEARQTTQVRVTAAK